MIKKMTSAWGIYHRRGNYITFNSELIEKNIESLSIPNYLVEAIQWIKK